MEKSDKKMPKRYVPDTWQYTTHNRNNSGRPGLSIPASPLEKFGLEPDEEVKMTIDGDRLILEKGTVDVDPYIKGNINCIKFSNALHALTEIDYEQVSYKMQAEILKLHLERIKQKRGERRDTDWKEGRVWD